MRVSFRGGYIYHVYSDGEMQLPAVGQTLQRVSSIVPVAGEHVTPKFRVNWSASLQARFSGMLMQEMEFDTRAAAIAHEISVLEKIQKLPGSEKVFDEILKTNT